MSQPPNGRSARDDETSPLSDTSVVEHVEVTTVEPPPLGRRAPGEYPAPEGDELVAVSELERVNVENDGTVRRRLDRVEQRPGRRGRWLVPTLLVVLAVVAAAVAAAWYFSQSDAQTVPAVEGLSLNDAVTRVEEEGFKTVINNEANDAEAGIVFRQDPSAGVDADEGSTVRLYASTGPADVTIPNTVGATETDARDRLAAVGLTANVVNVFSDQAAEGEVVAQSPAAGSQVAKGTAVRMNVSKGSATTTVPSLVGTTQADAESQLQAAGLKANPVPVPSTEPSGTVVAQNPVAGKAPRDSTVRLNVSTGP